MCFDLDSHPPIQPIAGGALDSSRPTLVAADGNHPAAFLVRAAEPGGAAALLLPDVRGLHPFYEELALRFAEHGIDALAIDWFGRTAPDDDRGEGFEHMPHVAATTWGGIAADIAAGVAYLQEHGRGAGDGAKPAVFTVGFCMGGRMSFLAATLGLGLAGVIGFYGTLVGPWRNDAPAPVDVAASIASPVLGLFGGADGAIPPDAITAFDAALASAGTAHRLVSYEGAPHSFFDRKAAEFADASTAAWAETLAFIADPGRAVAPTPS
jgi:carboxymethylenebutenolidase